MDNNLQNNPVGVYEKLKNVLKKYLPNLFLYVKTENNNLQNDTVDVYEKLKNTPSEALTSKALSKDIKQYILCIGLVPEGMQEEGIPSYRNRRLRI